MTNEQFFDESREQSVVKAEIIAKYFIAWAKIITAAQKRFPHAAQKIGYIDLFAGPGRYKDGAMSTPLRVLNSALEDPELCRRLVVILNDKDPEHASSLVQAITELPNVSRLINEPTILNEEVGEQIAAQFSSMHTIPLLAFIDPWGYKGLSLGLVNAFLKDWGCDCIFFFNYSRINAGISNQLVDGHMDSLFGAEAKRLRSMLPGMNPDDREASIIEALTKSLRSFGHRFVLPFCFRRAGGKRTSHHLVFVSKHFKGYEVMKEIMAKQSSALDQGVPSFQYVPPASQEQGLLFELNRPLDDLQGLLLEEFAGRTMRMIDIYEEHCVDTPFIKKNYKEVLAKLEIDELIHTHDRKSKRGFADNVMVTFP